MTIYIGVTQRSVPTTLLIGWNWQSVVNSRHVTWHQHLWKVTDCEGLCILGAQHHNRLEKVLLLSSYWWFSCTKQAKIVSTDLTFRPILSCLWKAGGHDRVFVSMVAAPLPDYENFTTLSNPRYRWLHRYVGRRTPHFYICRSEDVLHHTL